MSYHYIFFCLSLTLFQTIKSNKINLEIPSISSSHTFELSSNNSHNLHRNVLVGLVDGTASSISSSILIRTSYEQMQIDHLFNLYESKNQDRKQQIKKEPIFRSYLLTRSFNRSYPFIRVLIGSAQGSYEHLHIQSVCAVITAINEQNLYEIETCIISPQTGYCLVRISVLKMIDFIHQNQTTTKIEFYLKLHHIKTLNECISDSKSKQDHIHHETRIGHVDYHETQNIVFSTLTRSSISIDYPNGIHYSNWYFPLKLKLLHSSLINSSSFIIRCRLMKDFLIHSIQTNILKISNSYIQINHQISHREYLSDIDFNLTIKQINQTRDNQIIEIDLATIILQINFTSFSPLKSYSILFVDWFIISNHTHESIVRVPIHVQADHIQTIVALTDFTSLINTAMLSMHVQQYPLRILAVNHSELIQSIDNAICHSENSYLIQVDSNCRYIYFTGNERDDFFDQMTSPPAIVVRYEKYLQRLDFTIYIPERPLKIELSDTRLSRINGWFSRNRQGLADENQSTTSSFDDEDDDDDDDDEEDDDDEHAKCYAVYQQANVQVSTRFYRTTTNGDRIYLFNKFYVLITSFVQKYLETDNKHVAIIKNGRVIGIGPGKTSVRIYLSTNKIPMGSATISVGDQDLVSIQNISLNILTNINIETKLIEHIDPIYKIHFEIQPIFNRFYIENKDQFGQLSITLTYSDNTSISLDEIPSDYYQLNFDIGRSNLTFIYLNSTQSWQTIRIYPLALGQTSIHASLTLGQQQCTDNRIFSQTSLSKTLFILSKNDSYQHMHTSSHQQSDHYMIVNHNSHSEQRTKLSPFLIALSILLGVCVVLFLSLFLHWFINYYGKRQKSNDSSRRQRHSTNSGAEEDNHDWIFLDRNSLEMPINQPQPYSPSIHNSTLNITSNPLINTSTLQRQKELTELSHSQMIAYFDNLKESHA